MQTLKIKYITDEQSALLIKEYRRQYSNVLHFAFNRRIDGLSEKDIETLCKYLNNVALIKSYLCRCAVKNASQLTNSIGDDKKLIFGGKSNCVRRAKSLIPIDEYREKRIGQLMIIGEANQCANRMVRINIDCNSFTFSPSKGTRINLEIAGGYKRYKLMLKKLYELQQAEAIPITYLIDNEYIYAIFDETALNNYQPFKVVKNRVFAVDVNPNYVGWSVVDWKSDNEFNTINSGVISIKEINDTDYVLKSKKLLPSSKERLYINNKRTYEVFNISKLLVNKARHYHCEIFSVEALNIKHKDTGKGKRYNKLVNNMWNRNKMMQNLEKRCKCYGIKFIPVRAEYSSFIGNFLYRSLNLPDMVLASLEIGRRGYEFYNQYITKEKEIKKNIVIPEVDNFGDWYAKSLEEFGVPGGLVSPVDVYYFLKESKSRYRLSLDKFKNLKFSRCFSYKSKVKKIILTFDDVFYKL